MPSITDQIVETLPHLQRFAFFLTRDKDQADDLVQDCIERALIKSELFEPGTSLRAWMFTLMRNIFINGKRKQVVAARYTETARREGSSVQQPAQFHSAVLARAQAAIERLTDEEREAVQLLAVEQRSYETVAGADRPIGTLKSRLSRARGKLRRAVLAEERPME